MLRRARLCCIALMLTAASCTDQAPISDVYRLPPPDVSLDTNAIRIGEILYGCDRWFGAGKPESTFVLIDVVFIRRTAADPEDRPRPGALQIAEAAGLRPLFTFSFPIVRARIATDLIPGLAATSVVSHVMTVPDPRRYDWSADVGFSHPLTSQDSLDFVSLGGRVRYMWPYINALAGDLPNASADELRSRPGVIWVEAGGAFCTEAPFSPGVVVR